MQNDFCHIELNTTDVAKARTYYAKMFEWKFEEMDMGGHGKYSFIQTGKGPTGGLQKCPMPEAPPAWLHYVTVASVEDAVKRSEQLGGKTVVPPTPLPGMGRMAILQDPTGATFGVWAADQK
jgi:uncharacterized protein